MISKPVLWTIGAGFGVISLFAISIMMRGGGGSSANDGKSNLEDPVAEFNNPFTKQGVSILERTLQHNEDLQKSQQELSSQMIESFSQKKQPTVICVLAICPDSSGGQTAQSHSSVEGNPVRESSPTNSYSYSSSIRGGSRGGVAGDQYIDVAVANEFERLKNLAYNDPHRFYDEAMALRPYINDNTVKARAMRRIFSIYPNIRPY